MKWGQVRARLRRPVFGVLVGFLASGCEVLTGIRPFGAALLASVDDHETRLYHAVGLVLGAVAASQTVGELLLTVLPYALLLPWMLLLDKIRFRRPWRMFGAILAYLLPACLPGLTVYQRLTVSFTGLTAACLVPVVGRLCLSFGQIRRRLCLEQADILALCCVGGLAITSLPRTEILGVDTAVCPLLFSSMLAVTAAGTKGSVWGTVCGILWTVKGGDTVTALALITGSLLAGLAYRNRFGSVGGMLLGDLTVTLFLLNRPGLSLGQVNLVLACLPFLLLKEKTRERIQRLAGTRSGVNDLEMQYVEALRHTQSEKLKKASRMYRELAKSFTEVSHGDRFIAHLALRTENEVCGSCQKREYCLKKRHSDTRLELRETAKELTEEGSLKLPKSLLARCVRPREIEQAMKNQHALLNHAEKENPGRETEMALQLESLADMMEVLEKEIETLPEFDAEKEKAAADVLASRVGRVDRVICRKTGRGTTMEISMRENRRNMAREIEHALAAGFVGEYRCEQAGVNAIGGFFGTFLPRPRYTVSACAARQNKNGETVCGDAYTFGNVSHDRFLAAISDGAGSGIRAAKESESALNLLEAFADTCLSRQEIFRAMNRLLLVKGEKEEYSTVDAAEVDLNEGVLYMTKIGAVPGYLVRAGRVEKIENGALPMGIVTNIRPATTKKLVQAGDTVVLVSDGVYDALCPGSEDGMMKLLKMFAGKDKEEIARRLLTAARETNHEDDMTVLVLTVEDSEAPVIRKKSA